MQRDVKTKSSAAAASLPSTSLGSAPADNKDTPLVSHSIDGELESLLARSELGGGSNDGMSAAMESLTTSEGVSGTASGGSGSVGGGGSSATLMETEDLIGGGGVAVGAHSRYGKVS